MALTPASLGVPAESGIRGPGPVVQQFPLKADNRAEHRFVLDLGGWDDDAAVHEARHGVCQLSDALCLKCHLIEHLGWRWWMGVLGLMQIAHGVHIHFILSITLV